MQMFRIWAESDEFRETEVNHIDGAEWEFPIRYKILHDEKTGNVIFVGQDQTKIASVQQELVDAHLALEKRRL